MAKMYEHAAAFEKELADNDLGYTKMESREGGYALFFGGGDYSYSHMSIFFTLDANGVSAHISTGVIASVPENKKAAAFIVCNALNRDYRWMKFYLDKDRDLIADFDIDLPREPDGSRYVLAVMRTAHMVDVVYEEIMKMIWS